MSESVHKMNLVKVIDSRLSAGRVNQYGIEQGPDSILYRISPASSLSSTNINFTNINPNSAQTFMDRSVFVQVQYQINFTGTCPAGQNLLDQWGYDVAPRALFVNNSFRSTTVTLNSVPFSENTNDNLSAYTRVHFDKLKSYLSESTSVLDNCQLYSEGVGSSVNVLASIQNGQPGSVPARGGFQGVQILTNTPTSGSILLTGTEPIMISPLKFDDTTDHYSAFVQLSTFQANFNIDDNLVARLISVSNNSTATFTNIVASVVKANIYQNFYTSKLIQQVSPIVSYPWYKTNTFTRTGVPLAPGSSAVMVMDLINLSSIPKKIYVYVRPTKSSLTVSQTDTFCRINSIDVTFGTRNVMTGTDANSLYLISKNNGVDADFNSWYGSTQSNKPRNFSGAGSILALSPMLNFGLDSILTSGSNGPCQLQINVNYTSLIPSGGPTLTYDAYILCVQDGLITLSGSSCVPQEAVVGPYDLMNVESLEPSLTTADVLDYSGGSFWSSISDFWTKNKNWMIPVAKIASKGVKMLYPETAPILGAFGLGQGGVMSGGVYSGGVSSGGGLIGGGKISKKKLLQLIHR